MFRKNTTDLSVVCSRNVCSSDKINAKVHHVSAEYIHLKISCWPAVIMGQRALSCFLVYWMFHCLFSLFLFACAEVEDAKRGLQGGQAYNISTIHPFCHPFGHPLRHPQCHPLCQSPHITGSYSQVGGPQCLFVEGGSTRKCISSFICVALSRLGCRTWFQLSPSPFLTTPELQSPNLSTDMGGNEGGGGDKWNFFGTRSVVQKSPTDPGSDTSTGVYPGRFLGIECIAALPCYQCRLDR